MKIYNEIAKLSLLIILLTGCSDMLDLKNPVQYTEETYFVNAEQVQSALVATYATFYFEMLYQRGWFHIFDAMGNEGILGSGAQYREFYQYAHDPGNKFLARMWHDIYKTVFRANLTLAKIEDWNPSTQNDIKLKPVIEGQARFLRAFAYFHISNLWGRVPLRDDYEDRLIYDMPRADLNEIYALIDSDLEFAFKNLPDKWDNSNLGRITSGTALALWGKSYLFRKDYSKAKEKFEQIVSNENRWGYDLYPNYIDMFQCGEGETPGDNCQESLFEIQFTKTEFGSSQWYWFGGTEGGYPRAHSGHARWYSFKGWSAQYLPTTAARAFTYKDENGKDYIDPRASLTFYGDGTYGGDVTYMDKSATGPKKLDFNKDLGKKRWYKKYTRMEYVGEETVFGSTINEKVIRYADVLLMYAEALIQNGDIEKAKQQINRVRRRVNAFEYSSLGDKSTAMVKLKLERRLELCGEQHRYFDLVRWGDLLKVGNAERAQYVTFGDEPQGTSLSPIREFNVLFPIPQIERDVNSAITNDVADDWN